MTRSDPPAISEAMRFLAAAVALPGEATSGVGVEEVFLQEAGREDGHDAARSEAGRGGKPDGGGHIADANEVPKANSRVEAGPGTPGGGGRGVGRRAVRGLEVGGEEDLVATVLDDVLLNQVGLHCQVIPG